MTMLDRPLGAAVCLGATGSFTGDAEVAIHAVRNGAHTALPMGLCQQGTMQAILETQMQT